MEKITIHKKDPFQMMEEKDKKAELALLVTMAELPSAGARRDFAKEIGIEWEEYLRLNRKWRRVLDEWAKSKQ